MSSLLIPILIPMEVPLPLQVSIFQLVELHSVSLHPKPRMVSVVLSIFLTVPVEQLPLVLLPLLLRHVQPLIVEVLFTLKAIQQ